MGFRKKTVFVVGSGAHVDYGMPTGPQLIHRLKVWCYGDRTQEEYNIRKLVDDAIQAGLSRDTQVGLWRPFGSAALTFHQLDARLRSLIRKLTGSPHDSLDSILAQLDAEDQKLGRSVIAALLLQPEASAFEYPQILGWHRWLSKRCQPADAPARKDSMWNFDNLSVVTFNYDRLYEYHMQTLLINWSNEPTLRSFPPEPLHVYGRLAGQVIWDDGSHRFQSRIDPSSVFQSGESIMIADGRNSDEKHFEKVRVSLQGAEQVVFLGFAFDPLNLERLGLGGGKRGLAVNLLAKGAQVFATAYEYDSDRVRRAENALAPFKITWGNPGQGCVEFLKSWDIE